jgi:hydroxymethylbilane synthase
VKLRLGTRGSPLALAQCGEVARALGALGVEVEVVLIRTSGDRLSHVALGEFGGKALFVKEIEEALLGGQVDVGVHRLKNLPAELPAEFCLTAFPPREDPRDVLVTRTGAAPSELPERQNRTGGGDRVFRRQSEGDISAIRPRSPRS